MLSMMLGFDISRIGSAHRRPHRRRGDAVAELGAAVSLLLYVSLMVYFPFT
jgi:hypothetical protein